MGCTVGAPGEGTEEGGAETGAREREGATGPLGGTSFAAGFVWVTGRTGAECAGGEGRTKGVEGEDT